MKKLVLALALLAIAAPATFAKEKTKIKAKSTEAGANTLLTPASAAAATPAANGTAATPVATTLKPENIAFKDDRFDFGTVSEGAPAEHVFTFVNTGKEPLIIQRVQPSCGCTTPDWSKDPIPPGGTGMIKASYGTQGRPGHFDKSMTVFSNAGTRSVTFSGNVEKAPETSVPQNGSIMRN